MTEDAPKILDLATFDFDGFVQFFFAREIVPDEEQFDSVLRNALGQQFEEAETLSPAVVVGHMTKLFSEFGAIAPQYSLGQINQAIWGILGERLRLYELLWDESVPLPERAACIRSMYSVYSDFLCGRHPGPLDSGFYMWWDLILHGFWCQWGPNGRRTRWGDLSSLNADFNGLARCDVRDAKAYPRIG